MMIDNCVRLLGECENDIILLAAVFCLDLVSAVCVCVCSRAGEAILFN